MLFVLLVFIIALGLAGIAGWFSIVGLMAIFAASPWSIAIMAAGLEAGKLLTVSWLYRNWHDAPKRLKYPLTTMTIVLMLITSLGIFGFLSKAHIEQGAPVGNNVAKIERLDQRIAREQKVIDDATSVVLQLDNAVKILQDYDRIRGPEGALAVRESQKDERATLKATVDEAQANIDRLSDEKFELESTVRAFEVEVGPIKYVADMIYGESTKSALESAVQWLIIIIIFVFDPLAILLLLAANYSLIEYGLKLAPAEQKRLLKEKYARSESDNEPEGNGKVESPPYVADVSEENGEDEENKEESPSKESKNDNLEESGVVEAPPAWDEEDADQRMMAIAQNGNTGEHYDEVEDKVILNRYEPLEETEVAKTDDKVTDNRPRGIKGWLLNSQ